MRIYLDGALIHTTVTWEQYYRDDPEQTPFGNRVPELNSLLFLAHSAWDGAAPLLAGKGLLVDDVKLESSTPAPPAPPVPPTIEPTPPLVVVPPAAEKRKDVSPPTLRVGRSGNPKATIDRCGFMQRRGVSLPLRCDERCTVRASGKLSLRVHGKLVKLRVVKRTLAAGKSAKIRLVLSPKARAALRAGKKVKATVVLRVRDRAGNVQEVRRTIRLRG